MLDAALFLWVSQIPTRGVTNESAETRVITRIPPPSAYGMGTKFRNSASQMSRTDRGLPGRELENSHVAVGRAGKRRRSARVLRPGLLVAWPCVERS